MAYAGSTATTPNPPISIAHGIGGFQPASTFGSTTPLIGGMGVWMYSSTNLTTDMTSAGSTNFFTDALNLGMRNGDIVFGAQCQGAAGSSFVSYVGILSGLSTAGAFLSSGSLMTSTFG